ncbi:MAG: acetoacetate--CoA ligase, partial [Bacteroidetes bacterium]|nr:acetoacetate--CoA ligase [Bacteroidota bacterium]
MVKPLWTPAEERVKSTNMYRFMEGVNAKYGTSFSDYDELYQWSIDNLEDFYAELWQFAGIKASKDYEQVLDDPSRMVGTKWFTGSRLNFAENLLRYRDDQTALIFRGEAAVRRKLSYKELYR